MSVYMGEYFVFGVRSARFIFFAVKNLHLDCLRVIPPIVGDVLTHLCEMGGLLTFFRNQDIWVCGDHKDFHPSFLFYTLYPITHYIHVFKMCSLSYHWLREFTVYYLIYFGDLLYFPAFFFFLLPLFVI